METSGRCLKLISHKIAKPLIYFISSIGHRGVWEDRLGSNFEFCYADRETDTLKRYLKLTFAKNLIVGMIDEGPVFFLFVATLRVFVLRKTKALFLRPRSCFETGFRSKVKFLFFLFLRVLPFLKLYVILPYNVDHRLQKVSNDWTIDPDFWSNSFKSNYVERNSSYGYPISSKKEFYPKVINLLFIGFFDLDKGAQTLESFVRRLKHAGIEFELIIAGETIVRDENVALRSSLARYCKKNIEKFLSEDEFEDLLDWSDFVWCAYTKDYDQSSGVFGQALQKNKIPIVRANSMLDRFAQILKCRHLSIDPTYIDKFVLDSKRIDAIAADSSPNLNFREMRVDFVSKMCG